MSLFFDILSMVAAFIAFLYCYKAWRVWKPRSLAVIMVAMGYAFVLRTVVVVGEIGHIDLEWVKTTRFLFVIMYALIAVGARGLWISCKNVHKAIPKARKGPRPQ